MWPPFTPIVRLKKLEKDRTTDGNRTGNTRSGGNRINGNRKNGQTKNRIETVDDEEQIWASMVVRQIGLKTSEGQSPPAIAAPPGIILADGPCWQPAPGTQDSTGQVLPSAAAALAAPGARDVWDG